MTDQEYHNAYQYSITKMLDKNQVDFELLYSNPLNSDLSYSDLSAV